MWIGRKMKMRMVMGSCFENFWAGWTGLMQNNVFL
jgi:hypothetical protein